MKKLTISALFLLMSFCVTAQSMYDNTLVTKIEIYFSTTNWDQLLDNYYTAGLDERLLADSVVINGNMKDSVGVKYKGNSTYNTNNQKNPINIALDYVQANQDYQGYRTIKLSNGQKDPSFVREVLSFEIARKYMQAPQSNYAEVHINGAFHGLYVNTESINSDFQENYLYADRDNTRFKCNPESVFSGNGSSLEYLGTDSASYEDYYELKSDFAWQDLIDLTYTIANNPIDLESVLDVDRALWMLAFNNVLVNLDSYTGPFRQNYYLIKDDNNRMNTIIWDLNESFGGFEMINNGGGPSNTQDLIELDPLLRDGNGDWPLLNVLLSNDTYRRMYIAHMRTILEENFSNSTYETRANDLQSLISNYVQTDPNALFSYTDFYTNLNSSIGSGPNGSIGVTELMDDRTDYLQSHALFTVIQPSISSISSIPAQISPYSSPTITVNVSNANTVFLAYRSKPHDIFIKEEMFDDGLHGDGAAGDGIYGTTINVSAIDIQYYIYAENTDAGIFSPQRAEHEYHQLAVTSDLVINELMASNATAVSDQDGEFDDWVEIYNQGTVPIPLNDYYLSDNENNLEKWQFPNVTIQSGEYLIVWLDGDDGLQSGLHTNFKLSADGEELFLSSPSDVVDGIFYTSQITDMAFARVPNGNGPFTIQANTYEENNELGLNIDDYSLTSKIYPNPTQDKFIVECPENSQIIVYDIMGKVHMETSIQKQKMIQSNDWPSGLYFIKLGSDVHRLLIQ